MHGEVRRPLDEAAVRALVAARSSGTASRASPSRFMHSYANPAHERRARRSCAGELPGLWITLSLARSAPRCANTSAPRRRCANAYVQPLMAGYLERMADALAAEQFRGADLPHDLRRRPDLARDGAALPGAAGRSRARPAARSSPRRSAARCGEDKVLSFDMGGTTAKICLIENCEPQTARTFEVDRAARFLKGSGLPVRIPVIEMVEIGAGGGSIARVDALKRITVGPESAGSEPGPACYGARRQRADGDRRRRRARPDRPGRLRGRHDRARARAVARGARAATSASRSASPPETAAYARARDGRREHGERRARARGRARRGDRRPHADRLRRRGAAACRARRREARHRRASSCRRMPASARRSASCARRSPTSWCAAATCGSTRSMPQAATALLAEMAAEARALVVRGARGAPVDRARARPTCAMSARVTRSPCRCRRAISRRTTSTAAARRVRARTTRRCSRASIPGAAIEILTWSVLVTTAAAPPARIAPRRRATRRRRRPARAPFFDRPRRRHDRGAASIAASRPGAGRRASPARP